MAFVSKTLGQANPGAVLTTLYTAPAGMNSSVTISVCNTGIFAETYRVSVAVAGAADHQKQYLAYDKVIPANDVDTVTGIYLRAGDVVRVYGSTVNLSFTAAGTEG